MTAKEITKIAADAADTGLLSKGHVCQHGIRWPHECRPCADAAWYKHVAETNRANKVAEALEDDE